MNNLSKRIFAGIAGIPLIIGACYYGGIIFLIFSVIVTSLALWEFYSMLEMKGHSVFKIPALVSSAMFLILFTRNLQISILCFLIPALFISVEIFRKEKLNPLNPAIALFGLIYLTIPFVMLGKLIETSKEINFGIYIFILIWTCDTAAYFGGKYFGRHQLSAISPKKTWEGAAAGFLFTVIISLVIHFIFPDKINFFDAFMLGFITGIFSQVGDLFESLIKRYCGVKDSSNIIPGHGGILDRFDSLIFVTPVVFVYLNIKFL